MTYFLLHLTAYSYIYRVFLMIDFVLTGLWVCEVCDKDFTTPKKKGVKTPKKSNSARKWSTCCYLLIDVDYNGKAYNFKWVNSQLYDEHLTNISNYTSNVHLWTLTFPGNFVSYWWCDGLNSYLTKNSVISEHSCFSVPWVVSFPFCNVSA